MNWNTKKIKEVCDLEKGAIGITKAIPGKYPMVTMAEDRASHNEYQFDTKAVIIPLVSSTGHGHASMKRIHYQEGKFAIGSILCAIIPKNNQELDAKFLYHYLNFSKDRLLVPLMRGAANVSLSMKSIAGVEIPIPPLEEQKRLTDKIINTEKEFDLLHSELTHQQHLLTQLRQAILQEAVQGKLVPQHPDDEPASALLERIRAEKAKLLKEGKIKKSKPLPPIRPEEVPFELPEGWVWCRLDNILSDSKNGLRTGPFGSMLGKIDHKQEGIPVWGIESIDKKGSFTYHNKIFINETKYNQLKSFTVQSGDLIISRSGTIAELCVLPENVPIGIISTNLMKISLETKLIEPEYFRFLMKGSPFIIQRLEDLCSGSKCLDKNKSSKKVH